ncbi:hypothetical protein C2S52_011140 [Perilla frutescens var. hirtella]|nr:hypothetical protein C2S52_011140 [Perilla frutescens var. hirtella]KAH6817937.1 hypothetical protein C2S51_001540 [Perilla frutescens var. frutescens]
MGGCCCSSRKLQLHGTPVYYYYPPDSEEHESLTSHDGVATVLSSGLLIDLNLNMATPDTFRPPPAPLPYDVVLGRPQSTNVESGGATISHMDLKDCRNQPNYLPLSPKKAELELLKSKRLSISMKDEEDVCPTCLEEYNAENPKITTKCNHHFHLSCILEWMERSDTCPICDQVHIIHARPFYQRGHCQQFILSSGDP